MIAGPPRDQWLNSREAKLAEIKPIHESVDRADRIIVADIFVEHGRKQA